MENQSKDSRQLILVVESNLQGLRLDKALASHSEVRTRSRAGHLITQGFILVNNLQCKASTILKIGDEIKISFPSSKPTSLVAYEFPLDIKYEDEDLIVVNKPSGLVIHPAAGHESDTLVNALLAHTKNLSMKFGEDRPGIVHRLDKETSGLLVVAKNDLAHEKLSLQFKARQIHRLYLAVAIGQLLKKENRIVSQLARHPIDRKRYASTFDDIGKTAITNYNLIKYAHGMSYCRIKLETGRTHQIRVHFSEMGHPLVGDQLYGATKKLNKIESKAIKLEINKLNRFLLHAAELGFTHPTNGKELMFFQDWPQDIKKLLSEWSF